MGSPLHPPQFCSAAQDPTRQLEGSVPVLPLALLLTVLSPTVQAGPWLGQAEPALQGPQQPWQNTTGRS